MRKSLIRSPLVAIPGAREERRFSTALALDDSEDKKDAVRKASTRDKDEVKRTTKRTAKKPQRRITSRDTDRGFNPLQELRRARENVRRVIRRIL